MTELRRKMLEELQLRNYSPHTQRAYIRCVADFAKHFKAAPDRLGPEHFREYQLFLVQRKQLSWSLFNQTVCALRFFYHDVLHRNWMIEHIPYADEIGFPADRFFEAALFVAVQSDPAVNKHFLGLVSDPVPV